MVPRSGIAACLSPNRDRASFAVMNFSSRYQRLAIWLIAVFGTFAAWQIRGHAFDPSEQDDSLALLRHFADPSSPQAAGFSAGRFELADNDTVVLIGGGEMENMADAGYFELRLQRDFADKRPQVRNIAWSADTAYRQQRPMFFFTPTGDTREGSVADGREKIRPGVLIVQFGKMESLADESNPARFADALSGLVVGLKKITPRIVLVSPSPFFHSGPAAALAGERNANLENYVHEMQSIAQRQNTLFVDLRAGMDPSDASLSRDGVHLSEEGQQLSARLLAEALWKSAESKQKDAALLAAIQQKSQLWQQYYRPTNWAFLYGDRQFVPSSRDHLNADRRWFIEELNQLPGKIAAAESDIWKEAGQ